MGPPVTSQTPPTLSPYNCSVSKQLPRKPVKSVKPPWNSLLSQNYSFRTTSMCQVADDHSGAKSTCFLKPMWKTTGPKKTCSAHSVVLTDSHLLYKKKRAPQLNVICSAGKWLQPRSLCYTLAVEGNNLRKLQCPRGSDRNSWAVSTEQKQGRRGTASL